ncbi:MAG: glutamine--fructose-6-phosphate transaminase (isomerizing) [Alphaproteobacteria bacterium]|nr:glutamine--fructose-6-phosphate transaminase (isomerizing) [Alphaproteobacteria bacterium]
MCGIFGVINGEPAAPKLLEGLRSLEYRGYDSAGIAMVDPRGSAPMTVVKAIGGVDRLADALRGRPADAVLGIAHTRWATHGQPSVDNAHPHVHAGIAVVHNGIIENHAALRASLGAAGHSFATDTDTEVIPHLIAVHRAEGRDAVGAIAGAMQELSGSYAIAVVFDDDPDALVAARKGSPLVVGCARDGAYLSSDAAALAPYCDKVLALDDGEIAVLRRDGVELRRPEGKIRIDESRWAPARASTGAATRGAFAHFMLKEIDEQPDRFADTITANLKAEIPNALVEARRITFVACGSSAYAASVASAWLEDVAGIPCKVEIASEFRMRRRIPGEAHPVVLISQSGETADTLAALRLAKEQGLPTVALVNVAASQMAREADTVFETRAGKEVSVAATKSFTAQLAALAVLCLRIAVLRGSIDETQARLMLADLRALPQHIATVVAGAGKIAQAAERFEGARSALYLGRGSSAAVACEGALKLKEISYVHAEGYAAGELKHGPLALVDTAMPVVVLGASGPVLEKTASAIAEVRARGGRVLHVTDADGAAATPDVPHVVLPRMTGPAAAIAVPVLECVALQILAYHVAVARGINVDRPRNLAKSVTVE